MEIAEIYEVIDKEIATAKGFKDNAHFRNLKNRTGVHYEAIAEEAASMGMETVVDVGCGTDLPALFFERLGIRYIGIDLDPVQTGRSNATIIRGRFPMNLEDHGIQLDREKTMMISVEMVGLYGNLKHHLFSFRRQVRYAAFYCPLVLSEYPFLRIIKQEPHKLIELEELT